MSEWRSIETYSKDAEYFFDREEVDIWMEVYASPRSMGLADSFRVVDAWRLRGKWFHMHNGKMEELYADYITHWMPKPKPPVVGAVGVEPLTSCGGKE